MKKTKQTFSPSVSALKGTVPVCLISSGLSEVSVCVSVRVSAPVSPSSVRAAGLQECPRPRGQDPVSGARWFQLPVVNIEESVACGSSGTPAARPVPSRRVWLVARQHRGGRFRSHRKSQPGRGSELHERGDGAPRPLRWRGTYSQWVAELECDPNAPSPRNSSSSAGFYRACFRPRCRRVCMPVLC